MLPEVDQDPDTETLRKEGESYLQWTQLVAAVILSGSGKTGMTLAECAEAAFQLEGEIRLALYPKPNA